MSTNTFTDSRGFLRHKVPTISDDESIRNEQADKRHNPHAFAAGSTSTLKKVLRRSRIAAGHRPVTFNTPLVTDGQRGSGFDGEFPED